LTRVVNHVPVRRVTPHSDITHIPELIRVICGYV